MAIVTLVKEAFAKNMDGVPITTNRVDGRIFDWWVGGVHMKSPTIGRVTIPITAIILIQFEKGDKVPGVDPKP